MRVHRILIGLVCLLPVAIHSLPIVQGDDAQFPWQVGAATAEMVAEDDMVIGGGISPATLAGQEGKLQATATVIHGQTRLCLVGVDMLMMHRDYLDQAAHEIELECEIPFENILINASHTHHAPSTVTVHGYERDEEFCRRTVAAIVAAAKEANRLATASPPCRGIFRLGQEATVGQNSRQLLKDGKIYWIGPMDDFVRPTDPFDVDLPVLAFQQKSGQLAAALFNHSTHCIGARTETLAGLLWLGRSGIVRAIWDTHQLLIRCRWLDSQSATEPPTRW
ncbi:MAG: hypothetical protein R3C56_34870 [Pirellulaceae bacterium]